MTKRHKLPRAAGSESQGSTRRIWREPIPGPEAFDAADCTGTAQATSVTSAGVANSVDVTIVTRLGRFALLISDYSISRQIAVSKGRTLLGAPRANAGKSAM